MSKTRKITCKLIEAAEHWPLMWETIARETMSRMSEQEVADMARECDMLRDYFSDEEEAEE